MKFVTFEKDIRDTLKIKTEHNGDTYDDEMLPGYSIKKNKIISTRKHMWNEEDWKKYYNILHMYRKNGQLDKERCLVMAACHQRRYNGFT
tara:strand:+ start:1612 stop:1881 length:270 start_codon:yes stop_codon:yes gene_type:complete